MIYNIFILLVFIFFTWLVELPDPSILKPALHELKSVEIPSWAGEGFMKSRS